MTEPARRPDHQGWALRRLLDIHGGLRNDLARLQRAVTTVTQDGQDRDTAAAALGGLTFRQPGWTLRRFCAGFCGFVHGHHATEDTVLFPMLLRRQDPDGALGGVIDRLRAEHRTLTGCSMPSSRPWGRCRVTPPPWRRRPAPWRAVRPARGAPALRGGAAGAGAERPVPLTMVATSTSSARAPERTAWPWPAP